MGHTKGSDGESSSDHTPTELEGSELGHPSSNEQLLQLGIELQLQDSSRVDIDEENGSLFPSMENESDPAESIKERGEAWWMHALHERNIPLELAEECKAGIARTTWDGYLFYFPHFSDQWKKCAHGHIPDNSPDWTVKCADVFLTMKNRGFKVSVIQMVRAAEFFYSVLVFKTVWGDIAIIRILFPSGIRKLASKAMKLTGVFQGFKPFSFKEATLSPLTIARILPSQINFVSLITRVIVGTMKEQKFTDEENEECPKASVEDEAKREQANERTLSEEELKSEEVDASMEKLVEEVKTKTVRRKRTKGKKLQTLGDDDRTRDELNVEQNRQEEENDIFIIRTRAQAKRESKTCDFRSFDRSPKGKATTTN
eukprot:MONOS_10272.1-p1 / transcript=MONOS_10272.1 / gene=MONOS_10272 / organism=Monocercomonoides_exilis_PA203 / gene_product=unspecified product / transcript_product=unspecified product / location=Mono_scaffold00459:42141-43752(-) / protein_length=371 / sequence_SO=supercontig / SO=protein_coding / is_pseudo=false